MDKLNKYGMSNETEHIRVPDNDEALLGDFMEFIFKRLAYLEERSIVEYIKGAKFTVVSALYAEVILQVLDRAADAKSYGMLDWDSLVPIISEDENTQPEVSTDVVFDIKVKTDLVPYGMMEELTVLSSRLSRKELDRCLIHLIYFSRTEENSNAQFNR